jgi:hypothetical protein
MAGNTKLIGFMQCSKVRLERWGKKTDVEIGVPAVEALIKACQDNLPSSPDLDADTRFKKATGHYDAGRDEIVLSMKSTTVDTLRDILKSAEYDELDLDLIGLLERELSFALVERERYLSPQDEPGLE